MSKPYRLTKDQIVQIAPGRGSCFASDRIVVHGAPVGYLYREAPDSEIDSGWRFFAGTESQDYADNPKNFGLCDVNTVANYDPSIVGLLEAAPGATFERGPDGIFVPVRSPCDPEDSSPPSTAE